MQCPNCAIKGTRTENGAAIAGESPAKTSPISNTSYKIPNYTSRYLVKKIIGLLDTCLNANLMKHLFLELVNHVRIR